MRERHSIHRHADGQKREKRQNDRMGLTTVRQTCLSLTLKSELIFCRTAGRITHDVTIRKRKREKLGMGSAFLGGLFALLLLELVGVRDITIMRAMQE